MAETEASIGYGIILKKGNGAGPEVFTDFGLELTTVGVPGISRSTQDATHMQSPDGYTELIYGLKTAKPFTVQFNFIPANTQDVIDAIDGDKANWQLLFPDASTCTVAAAITDLDISGLTPDGKMAASATFTPSGKATWA